MNTNPSNTDQATLYKLQLDVAYDADSVTEGLGNALIVASRHGLSVRVTDVEGVMWPEVEYVGTLLQLRAHLCDVAGYSMDEDDALATLEYASPLA